MQYNRFLPLVVPLLVFILLEVFYFVPKAIFVVLVLIISLFIFTVRQFLLGGKREERGYNLLLLPVCFTLGLTVFSTMIPRAETVGKLFLHALFFLNAGFIYFYFRLIYYYLYKNKLYQKQSLRNLSAYGNFLAFYLIASSVYGLQAFLNIPVWILMISLLIFSGLIFYQVIWSNEINTKDSLFYILIASLMIIELGWAASFLTLRFFVLGLIMAVCYYVIIGMIRFHLLNTLNRKVVKLYLIFGFLSIFIVLLTARWI